MATLSLSGQVHDRDLSLVTAAAAGMAITNVDFVGMPVLPDGGFSPKK
jgi:hypothetical protein